MNEVDPRAERVMSSFTDQVKHIMERDRITRAELARRLDVTPPRVTQMLSGGHNLRFNTMIRIAHALGCDINLRLDEGEDHVLEDST